VHPNWLSHIDARRRKTVLEVLQTLSQLQNKNDVDFIVIGAITLLIRDYLRYTVYWDVDLLFKNKEMLDAFIAMPKPEGLRIVDYDDALVVNKTIASLHTAWAFDHVWFNVDYILRPEIYTFYTHNITEIQPYREQVEYEGSRFNMSLLMAHPWDIVIEKTVSPRTQRDIELTVDTSVDLRHIFAVCRAERQNSDYWQYLLEHASHLCDTGTFKEKLLVILSSASELGYREIEIPHDTIAQLKTT
jgi:hypothetical protein